MTEEEKAAIPKALVVNAPSVDGPINVELIKTLWTNPSPSETSFSAQNISLSSSDYDLLLCVHSHGSTVVNKGNLIFLNGTVASTTTLGVRRRLLRYSTDILYIADDGYYSTRNNSGQDSFAVDNNACIPIAIYGIKSSVTVDVSGVISDVSTSADKCMLSDGTTSVGDILDKGSVEVVSDGVKTLSQIYDDLFALIDNSKVNEHTKFDGITTDGTHYISFIDTYSTTLYRFTLVGTSYPAWSTTSVSIVSSGSSSTECIITNGVISQAITSSTVVPAGIIYRIIY